MSNARLRRKLEATSAPIVAAMIDIGHAHDECGILEFSYHGYCYPSQVINEARAVVDAQCGYKRVPMPAPSSMQRERL
jgi:hypothetical protein